MLKLASSTGPDWAAYAVRHLDAVLLDHAHCEKKAAGMAVTLVFQHPEHAAMMAPLSALAREELAHFEAVLGWLARRAIPFGRQRPSPYAGRLRHAVRQLRAERLLDTLLCSALIEARSCERLELLGRELDRVGEGELAAFYEQLRRAEARHHRIYTDLACEVAPRDRAVERLEELARHEARVLAGMPADLPRLHSGGGTAA